MTGTAHTLRELHRIHQQLRDVRERLERGPKQIRAREENLARLNQALVQAQADTKASRVAADQKQLQLKSGEAKIQELKVKLNMVASNREYQALREQIAASEMANSVLADEILDALEKVDELQRSIGEADQNVHKGQQELQAATQAVREKHGQLEAEVARLEGELRAAEVALPHDVREAYQRIIRSKGSDGMAQVDGEFCGGCDRAITPNMYNSLKLNTIVFCGNCGRLLYLPEDRSVGGPR